MTRKLPAELLGTAILVYVGCGTATLDVRLRPRGFVRSRRASSSTALAFGLVLDGDRLRLRAASLART